MGFTASQIRQDFNCFGGFGQQGYGYSIAQLCDEIEKILGIKDAHKCILIGAGNLGRTLVTHMDFPTLGFELCGVFDNNLNLIGEKISGYEIRNFSHEVISDFVSEEMPIMAILCVPRDSVESIVEKLYDVGIKSYWNFSHYDISMDYSDVIVENVHLNDSMMTLSYKISTYLDIDV